VNLAAVIALQLLVATPQPSAGEHLLAGARAFRDGRFDLALVEFRVAQSLGAEDAAPYAAATLVKLGRSEEAVEAFGSSNPGSDALLDYYRAVACYEARLYGCADRLLARLGERAGPRVTEQAARMRAAIALELTNEPPQASVDWYLARCSDRRAAGRLGLAAAYCREAADLAARRQDRYRLAEASSLLATLPAGQRSGATR